MDIRSKLNKIFDENKIIKDKMLTIIEGHINLNPKAKEAIRQIINNIHNETHNLEQIKEMLCAVLPDLREKPKELKEIAYCIKLTMMPNRKDNEIGNKREMDRQFEKLKTVPKLEPTKISINNVNLEQEY